MSSPAFQLYAGAWLSSPKIALMTPAQEGAYIRLLCYAWSDPDCSVPDDDQALAQLSRLGEGWFSGGSAVLRQCFVQHADKPGRLVNLRLLEERKKQEAWREKSRIGGLHSGKSRASVAKGASTTVEADGLRVLEPKGNSLSSSSIKKKSPLTPLQRERFERFWETHPARDGKKVGKAEALAYFTNLSDADQELLLIAVKNFAASRRVQEGFGIMDPARFICKLRPTKSEPWREWIEPEGPSPNGQKPHTASSRKPFTEVAL